MNTEQSLRYVLYGNLFETICGNLSLQDIYNLYLTCKPLYKKVKIYILNKFKSNIRESLIKIFDSNYDTMLKMLEYYNGQLYGSFVIEKLLESVFDNSDIDIMFNSKYNYKKMCMYMSQSYNTYNEYVYQYENIDVTTFQVDNKLVQLVYGNKLECDLDICNNSVKIHNGTFFVNRLVFNGIINKRAMINNNGFNYKRTNNRILKYINRGFMINVPIDPYYYIEYTMIMNNLYGNQSKHYIMFIDDNIFDTINKFTYRKDIYNAFCFKRKYFTIDECCDNCMFKMYGMNIEHIHCYRNKYNRELITVINNKVYFEKNINKYLLYPLCEYMFKNRVGYYMCECTVCELYRSCEEKYINYKKNLLELKIKKKYITSNYYDYYCAFVRRKYCCFDDIFKDEVKNKLNDKMSINEYINSIHKKIKQEIRQ